MTPASAPGTSSVHPYASEVYAAAFEGLASPLRLPALQTFALRRPIPGSSRHDAMGLYPLCVLSSKGDAAADFERLRALQLVSLSIVPDTFSGSGPDALRNVFDLVRAFKTHHVHDYSKPFSYDRHHRYEVRKARAHCEVRAVRLADQLDAWTRLYGILAERNRVTGLQRFSAGYFERLALLPGLHALAALHDQEVLAMHLFVEHEGVVYSHLACSSEEGYRRRAGYALNDFALAHFHGRRLIDFGGGAGAADDPGDGLATFKRGFANHAEMFYLCGKILDPAAYDALSSGKSGTAYFPAYRG